MTATLERSWVARNPVVLGLATLVVLTEVGLVASYAIVGANSITDWTIVLVPWVWINLGVWVLIRVRAPDASGRRRRVAGAVAVGYFGLLAVLGGLVGVGVASQPSSLRVALTSVPPGWAPTLLANTAVVRLSIVPFQFVGYLALAYLVYVTLLDAAGSAIGGILGLLSCVSCTWPLVASALTGILGSGAALSAAASSQSYAISTVVFVVTVGLLYWRPGFTSGTAGGA